MFCGLVISCYAGCDDGFLSFNAVLAACVLTPNVSPIMKLGSKAHVYLHLSSKMKKNFQG